MIILPDKNLKRGKVLLPQRISEWRSRSQREGLRGPADQTRFRLTARINDGHAVWRGWWDDRNEADEFLFALIRHLTLGEQIDCNIARSMDLKEGPEWSRELTERNVRYEFHRLDFLTENPGTLRQYIFPTDWPSSEYLFTAFPQTSPTGSNQNYDQTGWNATNTVDALGGGGNGARGANNGNGGGGGGSGGCSRVSNLAAGTGVFQIGDVAGDSWFEGTTLAGSSVGAHGGASASTGTGGAGGSTAGATGTTKNAGAAGGNGAGGGPSGGGGGAAGPTAAGGTGAAGTAGNGGGGGGADNGTSGNASGTTGGTGANGGGSGGAGHTGHGNGTDGGTGSGEWDATHGTGGGGGGSGGNGTTGESGGNGALYGSGGGGGSNDSGGSNTNTAGVGKQGIVVPTYTPLSDTLIGQALMAYF